MCLHKEDNMCAGFFKKQFSKSKKVTATTTTTTTTTTKQKQKRQKHREKLGSCHKKMLGKMNSVIEVFPSGDGHNSTEFAEDVMGEVQPIR